VANVSKHLADICDYKHAFGAGYNPRATGLAESKIGLLKKLVVHSHIDENSSGLLKNFNDSVLVLNTSYDAKTQSSPFYRFKGYHYRTKLDSILDVESILDPTEPPPSMSDLNTRNQLRRSLVIRNKLLTRSKQKYDKDSREVFEDDFQAGKYVFVRTDKHPLSPKNFRKSKIHKSGPFKILHRSKDNVILCDHKGVIGKNEISIRNCEISPDLPDSSFGLDEFAALIMARDRAPKVRGGEYQFLYYPKRNGEVRSKSGFWM
jgi:hypothetical protein